MFNRFKKYEDNAKKTGRGTLKKPKFHETMAEFLKERPIIGTEHRLQVGLPENTTPEVSHNNVEDSDDPIELVQQPSKKKLTPESEASKMNTNISI